MIDLVVLNDLIDYQIITISHNCRLNRISRSFRFYEIYPQLRKVTTSQYLVVVGFMRYYTRITISHGSIFHEILHQNRNISWLQIIWDITSESQYLMAADFMRFYTISSISHGCRFHEILNQNHNVPWLLILWYITQ